MEQRIASIMNCLSTDFGYSSKALGENNFEVSPPIPNCDHRLFLKFEVTDDIVRAESRYMFGNLNLEAGIGTQDLLDMLVENNGSFQATSAYLSVKILEGFPYVCLNSYQRFLAKWENKDIADILQLQFLDLQMGFMAWSFPKSIFCFQPSRKED